MPAPKKPDGKTRLPSTLLASVPLDTEGIDTNLWEVTTITATSKTTSNPFPSPGFLLSVSKYQLTDRQIIYSGLLEPTTHFRSVVKVIRTLKQRHQRRKGSIISYISLSVFAGNSSTSVTLIPGPAFTLLADSTAMMAASASPRSRKKCSKGRGRRRDHSHRVSRSAVALTGAKKASFLLETERLLVSSNA